MLLLPSLSRSKHIFTQNGNWEISVCRSLTNKTLSFPFNGSTQMKKPKHHIHNIRCDVWRQDVMGAQLINKNAESLSFSAAFTSASVSVLSVSLTPCEISKHKAYHLSMFHSHFSSFSDPLVFGFFEIQQTSISLF